MSKKTEALRSHLCILTNIVFLATVTLVLLSFFVGGAIQKYNHSIFIGLLLFLSAVLLSYLSILLFSKFCSKKKQLQIKTEIIVASSIFIFYLVTSIFIIFNFSVSLKGWDPGEVLELAKLVSRGQNLPQEGWLYSYFSAYPFQIFSGYFNGAYLRFMHLFCNFSDLKLVVLLNLFYVLGSLLFCYFTIRMKFGQRKALFFIASFPFLLPLLLYVPIVYTDTSSLFYLSGALFFLVNFVKKDSSRKNSFFFSIAFAIFMTLASLFKITSLIILIAALLYLLFLQKRPSYKRILLLVTVFFLFFIPSRLAVNSFTAKLTNPDWKYPLVHWVYMGIYDKGQFSMHVSDVAQKAVENGDDISSIEVQELQSSLDHMGVVGLIKLYPKKLAATWLDGSYFVFEKLRRDPITPDSKANQIVLHDYNQQISFLFDVFRLSRAIIVFLLAILTIKKNNTRTILKLSFIGIFLFLLFWETRSRYTLNFIPITFSLWIYGLEQTSHFLRKSVRTIRSKSKS